MDSFGDYFARLTQALDATTESYGHCLVYPLWDVVLPFVVLQVYFNDP